MKPRFIIAGGGTGGHLFPGLAVAEILRDKDSEVLFVGTQTGIEARILPERQFDMEYLWLSGFNRRKIASNVLLPLKLMTSLVQSHRIIRKFDPHAALGTGGYVCGPILAMAALNRVPIVLQEQNSFPGVTTKFLARYADEVFLNFEDAADYLPANTNWRHAGNPVRPGFSKLDRKSAIEKWQLNKDLPTLLVFGGSQGAMTINQAIGSILPMLSEKCNLIWSRGKLDKSNTDSWKGAGKLVVEPFIDDMANAYAASDLAVCRSGAMTLSELQAAALPAILIPYPYAAGDHQKYNAEAYGKYGGSIMIENKNVSGGRLLPEITRLFDNREVLIGMKDHLSSVEQKDAATMIADAMLEIAMPSDLKED